MTAFPFSLFPKRDARAAQMYKNRGFQNIEVSCVPAKQYDYNPCHISLPQKRTPKFRNPLTLQLSSSKP